MKATHKVGCTGSDLRNHAARMAALQAQETELLAELDGAKAREAKRLDRLEAKAATALVRRTKLSKQGYWTASITRNDGSTWKHTYSSQDEARAAYTNALQQAWSMAGSCRPATSV